MDSMVSGILKVFTLTTGFLPRFRSNGGTAAENLALQNIQVSLCAFILLVAGLTSTSGSVSNALVISLCPAVTFGTKALWRSFSAG